ncbi:SIS domain-containing protein [Lactococcus ileimucosae]|uniref:SIS domain-containing protein n=1 Tax=Lactococcus ileimucosae TaxID=2941329 RepID=A0ABV4D7U7_9LACT
MLAFFDEARRLTDVLEKSESKNIAKAAALVAESLMNDGIIQAFGSGHSYVGAIEIAGRAGGFIPSKVILDPAGGLYERFEGVGTELMRKVAINEKDIFFLISNSGRNPMAVEIASKIKESGNKLIVVTALETSRISQSRHSSGKLLYEFADVVLDNHSAFGDSALSVEGLKTKVCGTSSFATTLLLQETMYQATKIMITKGFKPPVYQSANIDGGLEYNEAIEKQYASRIFRF